MSDARSRTARYRTEDGKVCVDLELRNARQLFDYRDPAPFRERDLDDDAVNWILESLADLPRRARCKIVIHLRERGEEDRDVIVEGIRSHFTWEIERLKRKRLSDLRAAAMFFVVAIVILAVCLGVATLARGLPERTTAAIIGEGLPIVGWVAMWQPLEILLYEWWPYQKRIRLFRRALEAEIEL